MKSKILKAQDKLSHWSKISSKNIHVWHMRTVRYDWVRVCAHAWHVQVLLICVKLASNATHHVCFWPPPPLSWAWQDSPLVQVAFCSPRDLLELPPVMSKWHNESTVSTGNEMKKLRTCVIYPRQEATAYLRFPALWGTRLIGHILVENSRIRIYGTSIMLKDCV